VGHNEWVSTFAAVFAQTPQGWVGTEAVLAEAEGVDDVADLMREAAVESYGDPVVLLIEQDDDWFAVLRLDGQSEPQAFVSTVREDGLGGLFHQLVGEIPDGDAGGDPALLEDLGVDAKRLADLGERALPGDALLTVAELAGFGEEFDRLRD
jgi:putative tRNA adenosine deaminase-associated protein